MPTDRSLRALREASPRNQTGFDEWIGRFDPLREQIPAAPVPAGLLQEGTADVRAPAGMTRQVARLRRRWLSLRLVAGVAAALTAAAVALAVVVVSGAPHDGTGGPVIDTAYVVGRVDSALSAAGSAEIAQMTVTTRGALVPGGTTTAEEWSYGGQWHSVIYSPAGHLAYDEGASTASVYFLVSYLTRTWARGSGPGGPGALVPDTRGCGSVLPATVARALRAVISCGTLAGAGRQRVDGIGTIELTGRPDSKISETIWVSPDTYLPVRVVIRPAPGKQGPWREADITWLRPTAQNLARLSVPIPAGFRQVPFTQPVGPVPKYPGAPLPKSG
jgi:hypothetical protein